MLSSWAGELPYCDLLRSAQRSLPRLCFGMLVRNERRRDLRTPDRSRRYFVLRCAMRLAQRAARLADHYQCAKRQDDPFRHPPLVVQNRQGSNHDKMCVGTNRSFIWKVMPLMSMLCVAKAVARPVCVSRAVARPFLSSSELNLMIQT